MKEFFAALAQDFMRIIYSLQWYDFIDILLVAVVLYYSIKVIRQTRSFQLLKGVVFMAGVYLVVSALNMSASRYIFSQLFGNIVIVLVILFQSEIRHAIESVGRGDLKKFNFFSSKNRDYIVEMFKESSTSITKAVSNMSDKKIGALIVIEGKSLLGEYLGTGSVVDAKISAPVIENIFFPKAPLHDGALIIRDNRVHSAGCILPLTQSEVSLELGTRHRAAIGLSEHSDALVVVVSEETGAISIASGGKLRRNITDGELYEALCNFFLQDAKDKDKVNRRKK